MSAEDVLNELQKDVLNELQRYLTFDYGWDGHRGERFSPAIIARAQEFVQGAIKLLEKYQATSIEIAPGPASDGTVDIEIVVANRQFIVIFDSTDEARVYVARLGDKAACFDERSIQLNGVILERYIRWLIGRDDK